MISIISSSPQNTAQVSSEGHLLVCLCDLTRNNPLEVCPKHQAVKLQSLIKMDEKCVLHVYEGEEIVPLHKVEETL